MFFQLIVRTCKIIIIKFSNVFSADCKNLQDLNLSQCKSVGDDIIKELSVGCSSLLYLNISNTDISDASLRYISRYKPLGFSLLFYEKFKKLGFFLIDKFEQLL